MARIQAQKLLIGNGISQIKLVRTNDVALRAQTEEFALYCVEIVLPVELLRRRCYPANLLAADEALLRSTGMSL